MRKRLGERERGKDQTVRNKDLIEKDKIRNQEIDGLQVTDKEKWGVVSNMVEKSHELKGQRQRDTVTLSHPDQG